MLQQVGEACLLLGDWRFVSPPPRNTRILRHAEFMMSQIIIHPRPRPSKLFCQWAQTKFKLSAVAMKTALQRRAEHIHHLTQGSSDIRPRWKTFLTGGGDTVVSLILVWESAARLQTALTSTLSNTVGMNYKSDRLLMILNILLWCLNPCKDFL